ncbi:MAG: hypothetical protein KJ579_05735 [Verrucomicrobia bacterium]|nr:hypothetical protein [Verrucomicrobiota bacterium]
MKKLAGVLAIATVAGTAQADLFFYDFGTGASNHTSGISTAFLPQPSVGGGEDRVRVGTGSGGYYMENPGDAGVGSGTELRMVAPTATSVNKFSIYDYTAGKTFSLGMTLKMTGGASGTFSLFVGDGTTYSDSTSFSSAQVFTGLRLALGASDTVTTTYRNAAGDWVAASFTPFAQNSVYQIEIYGNNTTGALNYEKGGTQTLNANEWDLWINGTLWDEGLGKALLPADVNIDSFMIYGESSVGNVANLIIDDITYSNDLTVIPEPATAGLIAGPGLAILLACLRRRRENSAAVNKV